MRTLVANESALRFYESYGYDIFRRIRPEQTNKMNRSFETDITSPSYEFEEDEEYGENDDEEEDDSDEDDEPAGDDYVILCKNIEKP